MNKLIKRYGRLATRWFCPACRVERTGDRLDRPCRCLKTPRQAQRAPRQSEQAA